MRVPAVDALLCPNCGAINTTDARGNLTVPTPAELDLLLTRPEVRRVIEQASAIRQALFGGQFTLTDPTCLLDAEPFGSLSAAIARANTHSTATCTAGSTPRRTETRSGSTTGSRSAVSRSPANSSTRWPPGDLRGQWPARAASDRRHRAHAADRLLPALQPSLDRHITNVTRSMLDK